MNNIINNIKHIRNRMASACERAGREADSVRLLLATKTVASDRIRVAIEAGETLLGENRIQEFAAKNPELSDLKYERHFIGHLQTNKIKDILKYDVKCIQSLDSAELMHKLDQRLQAEGRSLDIMVQVNTSFEASKYGLNPDEVPAFLKELNKCDTLKLKGFMTIGLFDSDTEAVRRSYTLLRELRDMAISEGIVSPESKELSMGMSADLETAIEEGATIVRVGSAIFGTRTSNR
ncbi:MAG: YggS family pyridoxal phosphate-dependent enzyme [Prevotellaceae bacterium]|jgi:pyridoxal phosphate enzyme (YggS family)|nr:YggS family pyridoxal phosphate-dependent enzyme [Prevotellaceae bacterium]